MSEPELTGAAFPTLTAEQMEAVGECSHATLERYRDGEALFQAGDRDFRFYIVRAGAVEIRDESGTGDEPRVIHVHGPAQFTGDIAHLTGRPAIVSAVARGDTEVYAVTNENLRLVLNQCPDFADLVLGAFIARRQILLASDFTGALVIGSRYSLDAFRIRDFLASNRLPFKFRDLEVDADVDQLLKRFGLGVEDTPVVLWGSKLLLRNPSNRQLADTFAIRRPLERKVYDLLVVGAGPAGLAAAVYAASEGLTVAVLERTAPGGQAGRSMRIENYLGFPMGITGDDLAGRAVLQANKFGAQLTVPAAVSSLVFTNGYPELRLEDGDAVTGKCLLIATGAEYRKLEAEGCAMYEGRGVYYAATPNEAPLAAGADVIVVGGGNSAGQAAAYLAAHARRVFLVLRGGDLYRNMSSYLAHRVEATDNIEVLLHTSVLRLSGNGHLRSVELVDSGSGKTRTVECPALFSFIGAVPRTDWLPAEIEKDAQHFVRTGDAVRDSPRWTAKRAPYLLETSQPGVFAAGDVRSGSVKRVASAVGEGSMAVQFVHGFLAGS